jgi:hypothetical protein
MAHRSKKHIVLRASTPAERREDVAILVSGGAYRLMYWAVVGLHLWRLWRPL